MSDSTPHLRDWLPVAVAVVRRPDLWSTAVRQVLRLAPAGWWRSWPPVPLPAPDYLQFRTLTQYGQPDHAPSGADVITWLEWSRSWGAVSGASRQRHGEHRLERQLSAAGSELAAGKSTDRFRADR